jgi:hypothetical protein
MMIDIGSASGEDYSHGNSPVSTKQQRSPCGEKYTSIVGCWPPQDWVLLAASAQARSTERTIRFLVRLRLWQTDA